MAASSSPPTVIVLASTSFSPRLASSHGQRPSSIDDDIVAGAQTEWLAAKAILHARFFTNCQDAKFRELLPDCVAALGMTRHGCDAFRVDARDLPLRFAARGGEHRQLIESSGLRRVTNSFDNDEGRAVVAACAG